MDRKNILNSIIIEFRRLGNFWIDNGIVALWKILRRLQSKERQELDGLEFDCKLQEDGTGLTVTATSNEMLDKVMNKAKSEIINSYLGKSGNLSAMLINNEFKAYETTSPLIGLNWLFNVSNLKKRAQLKLKICPII